jgi:hypothetical protein
MMKDVLGGAKRMAGLPFMVAKAAGDFQCGFELGDFRRTDSFDAGKLAHGGIVDAFKAAESIKQQPGVIDGVLAGAGIAISQDDGEKLRFTQGLSALIEKLFSRPVRLRPLLDGLVRSHAHLAAL